MIKNEHETNKLFQNFPLACAPCVCVRADHAAHMIWIGTVECRSAKDRKGTPPRAQEPKAPQTSDFRLMCRSVLFIEFSSMKPTQEWECFVWDLFWKTRRRRCVRSMTTTRCGGCGKKIYARCSVCASAMGNDEWSPDQTTYEYDT